jgi:hypothetical protein
MAMVKIRTIKEAYAMLKAADPDSSLSYFHFRRTVLSGAIPYFTSGNRYLLNYQDVEDFYCGQNFVADEIAEEVIAPKRRGGMREISA